MIYLIQQSKNLNLSKSLSFITCLIYIYIVFMGISGPRWGGSTKDPYEIVTSNPINQVVYSSIFIFTIFSILPHYKKLLQWLNREKYVILFLLWCGLSILWSQDSLISFKRYIQYITTSLVFIALFLNWKSTSIIFSILKVVFPIYLIFNIIMILTNPLAIDPEFHTWRGIHEGKNILGQTAVLNIIFFAFSLKESNTYVKKIYSVLFLMLSLLLLIGSTSGTSIISLSLLFAFYLFTQLDKIFKPIGLGHKVSSLIIATIFLIVAIILILSPEELGLWLGSIGKDPTFTGRTDLWMDLLILAEHNIILGFGYQAFWIPTSPINLILFQKYIWLPNQAHNGYIDIIVEIGVIGLFFFIVLMFSIRKRMVVKENLIWTIYIVFALLINLQESTLLRPHHFTNVFFYLSFWAISFNSNFTILETGDNDEKKKSITWSKNLVSKLNI